MENIVRKGEIACNKQCLIFSQYFLPYWALTFHFKYFLKCCLQFVSVWTSLRYCCMVMGSKVTAFSSFPTMFSKGFFSFSASKVVIVW